MTDRTNLAASLLPCPFCGNDDIQDWGESTWSRPVKWMYCTECQTRGPRVMLGRGEPKDHWHHRIREEWNTRAAISARDVVVPADVRDYAIEVSEAYDTTMEVERNPAGAWQVIQALAGHIASLAPSAVDDSQTPNPAINAPDPIHRPTMTDMMVDPDTLDAFMEANPLPDEIATTPAVEAPAEDAHVKGETAGQMLERLGMDGVKWAAEFRTTALRLGYSDMDEGWLIGWFCNAIMAGYDRSSAQAREAAIRECASALRKVIDYAAFAGADPDEVDDEAINSYADYLLTLIEKEPRA